MKKSLVILSALGLLLCACALRKRNAAATSEPVVEASKPAVEASVPATVTATLEAAYTVQHVTGSTQKICQLTGDNDRQTAQPTLNQTQSRYGVFGTDLGFSFLHDGRLYFLFGDTVGLHGGDSIAYSQDTNPDDCLDLTFVTGADGRYLPPKVPGISLGAFEVPVGGFSAGGSMSSSGMTYVFFTTDHTDEKVMGRSVLARSSDGARSFTYLYDVSTDKFINIAPVVVDNAAIPGLPESSGQGLLVFGTGTYRRSNPYLAFVPLASVEEHSAWLFYAGLDTSTVLGASPTSGLPRWSADEADAAPLFDHPCLGELSAAWNADLGKWLMFYNCALPRGITMRSADRPWGSWTDGEVIFQPWDDGGYCNFMHVSYQDRNCDSVQDPGRDDEWAGEYGPYIISSLARTHDGVTTVYFVMSTWNPYAVMLMKTDLRLVPAP